MDSGSERARVPVSAYHEPGHDQGHGGSPGGVPHSTGISPVMIWFLVLSLVLIFMQAGFVIGSSRMGHTWPANDSTKVALPEAAR